MDSGSALRVEKTTLKPVIKKTYVLDTNVLLHDPTAVTAFKQHHVVIPMTVLEELDHIKDRHDKTVSREARIAIQMIDKVVDNATPQQIQEGVEVPGTGLEGQVMGTLAIYPDQRLADNSSVPYLDDTQAQANDNRIINVALRLQAEHPNEFVCLVTKDINMRIKAKGSGLVHVEDYRRDRVLDDIDLLARGYEHIEGDFWSTISEVDTLREGDCTLHRIPRKSLPQAYPNMFLYDDHQFMAFVKRVETEFVYLRCDSRDNLMNRRFWGLVAAQPGAGHGNVAAGGRQCRHDGDDRPRRVWQDPAGAGLRRACHPGAEALLQADRGPLHAPDRGGNRVSAGY